MRYLEGVLVKWGWYNNEKGCSWSHLLELYVLVHFIEVNRLIFCEIRLKIPLILPIFRFYLLALWKIKSPVNNIWDRFLNLNQNTKIISRKILFTQSSESKTAKKYFHLRSAHAREKFKASEIIANIFLRLDGWPELIFYL